MQIPTNKPEQWAFTRTGPQVRTTLYLLAPRHRDSATTCERRIHPLTKCRPVSASACQPGMVTSIPSSTTFGRLSSRPIGSTKALQILLSIEKPPTNIPADASMADARWLGHAALHFCL